MITKSELETLLEELNCEDRERLGDPPSVEEMLAYMRGELAEPEEERVRALLVAYPELARALVQMSDEDVDVDVDRQLAAFNSERRVVQFPAIVAAIAAALALAFGVLLWRAESRLGQPRVAWDVNLLTPDGRRGGPESPIVLQPAGDSFLIETPLPSGPAFKEYRLDIVEGEAGGTLWRSSALRRSDSDSFALLVPRRFLKPGKYRVVLYGVDGGHEEKLATYSVQVGK